VALPIGSIGSVPSIAPATTGATPAATPGAGFGDALTRMLQSASDSEDHANSAVGSMLDGSGEVHDAMIALQRAELSLQLTVQVRNKLVSAYQDIMRMPV
jgi:flagellar hook-basal body complex protein FliE